MHHVNIALSVILGVVPLRRLMVIHWLLLLLLLLLELLLRSKESAPLALLRHSWRLRRLTLLSQVVTQVTRTLKPHLTTTTTTLIIRREYHCVVQG